MNKENTITSIGELASRKGQVITHIKIAENLTQFPQGIFAYADTLEILDLSNNQLTELPDNIAQLSALKVLFVSNNRFTVFPSVLFECLALTMIGFKANQIHTLPENALPQNTRWLILTDNAIKQLPDDIGRLSQLQKCMLAGNDLTELPLSLKQCQSLQLLRISANQLRSLPASIEHLSELAWLAVSGNIFLSRLPLSDIIPQVSMSVIKMGVLLGEGASGLIYKAHYKGEDCAVKCFKGDVTSDGYPQDELLACLHIPAHPSLVKVIARIDEPNSQGVVMELIPERFSNLGLPPSLASCTRDVFDGTYRFNEQQVSRIIKQMADVLKHIHEHHFIHGDVYAHNVLVDQEGHIIFGDMGAASYIGALNSEEKILLLRLDYRAFSYFIDDILSHCADFSVDSLEQSHPLNDVYIQSQKIRDGKRFDKKYLMNIIALL